MTTLAAQTAANQLSRSTAIALGFGVMLAGVALFLVRSGMTEALNRLYRGLPGKFQYPPWFITVFAGVVVVFGAAVVLLSSLFGKR